MKKTNTLIAFVITLSLLFSNIVIAAPPGGGDKPGGGGSSSNTSVSWSGNTKITTSGNITDKTYSSTTANENALLLTGDITVTFSKITVNKTGDSDGGDSTSFYGMNSGILAKDGANVTISNSTITTDANGANGVFSYGGSATTNNTSSDGTTITISDSKIKTSSDQSGGIMVTGGGKLVASNLEVETAGTSSAAIRSDRGGGTLTVNGGTYKTTGTGSPAIYSTATIDVKNATLEATTSEGIIVEGANSVTIDNVTLTDTNNKLNGQSTTYKNIFLYQSVSGDASSGGDSFTAKNSTITTNKGDTIYVTNQTSEINLENNTFVNNDSEGYFLRAKSDSWGQSGSNGGYVTLNATNQEIKGNIYIDNISTLDMNLEDNSYFEGAIDVNNVAKEINLTLSSDSKIILTGDSYLDSLDNEDTTNSNIYLNNHKLYVDGKEVSGNTDEVETTVEETVKTEESSTDDTSLFKTIFSNPIYLTLFIIAILVIILLIVLIVRKIKKNK